jgi:hypothetical protein
MSHPSSEKAELKPLYVRPGGLNHTYDNNMINRYSILLNDKLKSYEMINIYNISV